MKDAEERKKEWPKSEDEDSRVALDHHRYGHVFTLYVGAFDFDDRPVGGFKQNSLRKKLSLQILGDIHLSSPLQLRSLV